MNMPPSDAKTLRSALAEAGASGCLCGAEEGSVPWSALLSRSVLAGRSRQFQQRSVLIAVNGQFTAAAALLELDGFARRVILYPPDLSLEHLDFVIDCADVDVILSDRSPVARDGVSCVTPSASSASSVAPARQQGVETEWILLTSGTTGRPKLVLHTLASLTGAMEGSRPQASPMVWSTFYDMRRYGGLQIFLRAVVTGSSLVLSSLQESTADFLMRAASLGVTHISGTPSHWRRALMSPAAHALNPQYVRLSGEIADQGVLNQLRARYPQAKIGHAFATTEAGVAFVVNDCLAGFAATMLESTAGVEMKVEDGSLRIRSARTARCYLGGHTRMLRDADGFVDTGDVLQLQDDRFYFAGRADGMINVGGMKVFPEEVESVINRHPDVQMSLVRTRKNPVIGALVVAEVVLKSALDTAPSEVRSAVRNDVLRLCRETLPPYKVPATITFVATLAVAETGKLIRLHA